MEIFLAIIGLVVGFAAGILVMRNNYKYLREFEVEVTELIKNKKFTKDELLKVLRDKFNI